MRMNSLQDLRDLEARAWRIDTACGEGPLVWHGWGDRARAPVLLLHGGGGSWTHWARNIETLLAQGRSVMAPDMPGFGDSATAPDGQDVDVLPGWLEQGADILLGGEAVDVVGFSLGGLVASLWALAFPQRFRRLVLVGAPSLRAVPEGRRPDMRNWEAAAPGAERLAAHRHNLLQMMVIHEASADAFATAVHAANIERDRMRRRRLMRTDLLARRLPDLHTPLDAIYGDGDVLYDDDISLIGRVLATAPGWRSLALVPDAGHWVQFEAAAAFDAALARALAD